MTHIQLYYIYQMCKAENKQFQPRILFKHHKRRKKDQKKISPHVTSDYQTIHSKKAKYKIFSLHLKVSYPEIKLTKQDKTSGL